MKWKSLRGIGLTTFFLAIGTTVGALVVSLSADSAQAAFTCGPYMKTYRVTSLDGVPGLGVRCLKFLPLLQGQGNSRFVWYGEGDWRSFKYRHLGQLLGQLRYTAPPGEKVIFSMSAADIFGNGEDARGVFPEGSMYSEIDHQGPNTNIPPQIIITSPWRERWTLETDNVVNDYTSSLGPIRTCGSNLVQFSVRDANGNRNGQGVRCGIKDAPVWYGEGTWGGGRYAHLGYFASNSRASAASASDLCEPSKSAACGNFPMGSLQTSFISPVEVLVKGAWNEIWKRS